MMNEIVLHGTYIARGCRFAGKAWQRICADHRQEWPKIEDCYPGTLNVLLFDEYYPPDDDRYRSKAKARGAIAGGYEDGNHISPRVKFISINSIPVEAWLYRGGNRSQPILELISDKQLSDLLEISDGDQLILRLIECDEGEDGMPEVPPVESGRIR